ncbi:ACT domain-containing protein [Paludibaculum fermentans]|uniref:ACT domain-containing protein n=1 Tax=Paludibaculum fermentans TaxID=1473598 RepID=UPI001E2C29B0|nr:ACT domain-containing protein [Paludibaculum fermentans]
MQFRQLKGSWAVCRLGAEDAIPDWAGRGPFVSITRTPEELSVVCPADQAPDGIRAQAGWACLQLAGPFDFALTGILASFLQPLAEAAVPIFALSTFDTDWVLIPEPHLARALDALRAAGHDLIV